MSLDADTVLAKAAQVERALVRVETMLAADRRRYDALTVADVIGLNLQRACQSAIDLAHHVVAAEGLGLPQSLADAFVILEQRVGLERELARSLRAMVGFRNMMVHAYDDVDTEIVARAATAGAVDLRRFVAWAIARLA